MENGEHKLRGRPFPKGVSGNPGGRPKGARTARQLLAPHAKDFAEQLLALAREPNLDAIRLAFEYLYGKPSETPLPPDVPGGAVEQPLTPEEAERLLEDNPTEGSA